MTFLGSMKDSLHRQGVSARPGFTASARAFWDCLAIVEQGKSPAWSERERRWFWLCAAVSAVLYVACAVFCFRHFHPDEYFQVVEAASVKLGLTDVTDLPWEFQARMRSWLQPAFYVGVAHAALAVGIDRPLSWLFLFRLSTGIISWASLWMLIAAGRRWIASEDDRRCLYLIAALLWILPFLGVRTSAETMASAMLCIGIALMEWRSDRPTRAGRFGFAVLAGIAFGLCFGFRYTSAVMAAGAVLNYLRPRAERPLAFFGMALGGCLALAFGALIDRWGYGVPVFPAFSYIYENFVVGRAAAYGTSPFFGYIYKPLETPMAPVAAVLMLATVIAWVRRPWHVLTFATVPYVLLLSIVGHKEQRFIFPLVPLLPMFVMFALAGHAETRSRAVAFLRWCTSQWRLRFLLAWNIGGLVLMMWLPSLGDFSFYRTVETEAAAAGRQVEFVVIQDGDKIPYWQAGIRMHFIEPKNLQWVVNPSLADLQGVAAGGEPVLAMLDVPTTRPGQVNWIRTNCALLRASWPGWLRSVNWFGWQDKMTKRELYRCQNPLKNPT
ncbi:MAG TPA: hypothetical protein VGC26_06450 [Afipia sp.]